MFYSDYYNMCVIYVFLLIMNILFCSSFKLSFGIYIGIINLYMYYMCMKIEDYT